MHEDVGEFEVTVHDLVLIQGLEGIQYLDEELYRFLLGEGLFLLEVLREIAFVAVLEDEVEVVGGLLDVVQLDDVAVVACLQYFDLVLQQFQELACVGVGVPLMFSRLMALMAMSELSDLL
jgi:hypothetical protein